MWKIAPGGRDINTNLRQLVRASLVVRLRPQLLLFLLCTSNPCFADSQILIITTSDSRYQQQLSNTIKSELDTSRHATEVTSASLLDENSINNKKLVIAIGRNSVTIIRKKSYKTAVLNVLTGSSRRKPGSSQAANESTIYMTQPLCRQFRLIRALNPAWKTVSLLLSEENDTRASTLSACARRYKLTTRTITLDSSSDLITALNTALNNSDVLLSLPDPSIYNSHTIKSILLTSYRHRVPVIGFSESFANAGAIAAVHTSPEQLGSQIAKIVLDYFENNESFSQSEYYPSDFSVTTNRQVAHSLEIKLDKAEAIESALRKLESGNE